MLTQLLPSSTVAAGMRLNCGLGTVASAIPGGTCQPAARSPGVSGGVREPSQYALRKCGSFVVLGYIVEPLTPEPGVSTEYVALSVAPPVWLPGPVSPRTPTSQ